MSLLLSTVGLSHKTAPVELRESFVVDHSEQPLVLQRIQSQLNPKEALLLSTCNRTELYLAFDAAPTSSDVIKTVFTECISKQKNIPQTHLYALSGSAAVEHAFRVTSSLDSMVVGEAQILGQVKQAYDIAKSHGSLGTALERCFQYAFATAKKIRTETKLGEGSVGVGSVAVNLSEQIFSDLSQRVLLVVGAGEMAESMIPHFVSRNMKVRVMNRTHDKALKLANDFSGTAVEMNAMASELANADLIITSTSAQEPLITCAMLRSILKARKQRPLFLIDIALPRNIEPSAGDLDNVYRYDLDDLMRLAESHLDSRKHEMQMAETILLTGVRDYLVWQQTRSLGPLIQEWKNHACHVVLDELQAIPAHTMTEEAKKQLARTLASKILHRPLTWIKQTHGVQPMPINRGTASTGKNSIDHED